MDWPSGNRQRLLARALVGSEATLSQLIAVGRDEIVRLAHSEGVFPLLADRVTTSTDFPRDVRAWFQAELHKLVALDLEQEFELVRALDALGAAGIETLVIKGSHLAYTHYQRPELRARVDTDLLVAPEQRAAADTALVSIGYTTATKVSGDYTATQRLYLLRRADTVVHQIDVHWRLASPQIFAEVLPFQELRRRAVRIPRLGERTWGPSPVDALVIACVHRVAHHSDEPDQLKWLYDIHLIASRLGDADWERFVEVASDRGVAAVCIDGIERASHCFDTTWPRSLRSDVRLSGARARERTAGYLKRRTRARVVLDDFRALPTWRDRLKLAREHALPGSVYMRTVYAPTSTLPLPLLYVLRVARGARAWLSRSERPVTSPPR